MWEWRRFVAKIAPLVGTRRVRIPRMKIQTTKFRCDLCGEFRKVGVTESRPSHSDEEGAESTQTHVCSECVTKAVKLLADRIEAEEHA